VKRGCLFLLLLACHAALALPLKTYMSQRPVVVKLGYTPSAEALNLVLGDQKNLVAEILILKVLFYFGSLVENWQNQVVIPPEYLNMFRTIETAVKLDPYNMDAYYFAQSAFTWEIGHAADVNRLLIRGMKYRSWDWYLPYFVGFNAAYFLRDFETASHYTQKAAEISGSPLLTTLAARYFFEAGHNDLGIVFLRGMVDTANDLKVKNAYQLRLDALEASSTIDDAIRRFSEKLGVPPVTVEDLVTTKILEEVPRDPYGGRFFIDETGKARSSSSFTAPKEKGEDYR
jgi:tetratricopeptide (TPR) repeat protein